MTTFQKKTQNSDLEIDIELIIQETEMAAVWSWKNDQ